MLVTDAEPDRFAPLAPPAPLGLRGVWVVRRAVRQPLADAIRLEFRLRSHIDGCDGHPHCFRAYARSSYNALTWLARAAYT